jgi:hypothetical protein
LIIEEFKRNLLVIICPQNDFHDRIPEHDVEVERIRDASPTRALPVK